MRQVKNLVPKNKFDFSGMEELMKLSDEEIEPVIPELLAWMKDMNWPVAKEMPALERIVKNPTRGELAEEANIAAEDFLK